MLGFNARTWCKISRCKFGTRSCEQPKMFSTLALHVSLGHITHMSFASTCFATTLPIAPCAEDRVWSIQVHHLRHFRSGALYGNGMNHMTVMQAHTTSAKSREYIEFEDEVLMALYKIVDKNGARFAFPTTTVHHSPQLGSNFNVSADMSASKAAAAAALTS